MRILLLYHFFHPDHVVSARMFSDLARSLVAHGHQVTVFTSNRLIRGGEKPLPILENWEGIQIRRFARPPFCQSSNIGRLLNSFILQLKWVRFFFKTRRNYDAAIVGTDPQFSYAVIPFFRLFNRKLLIAHWCFDLYPEAIMVDFPLWAKALAALSMPFVALAYHCTDVIADLGPEMRQRMRKYRAKARAVTLTPWAIIEPDSIPFPDPEVRRKLFGDAKLGLLYSGTVGNAHDLTPFIALARECRKQNIPVGFCFAGYGNRYAEELSGVTAEDVNIRIADFVAEKDLPARLAAADMHLVSIAEGWEGIVLPSKIFGSLAMGRSMLYSGAPQGMIDTGNSPCVLFLDRDDPVSTAEKLRELIGAPEKLRAMNLAAFEEYRRHYSRTVITEKWNHLLAEAFEQKNGK